MTDGRTTFRNQRGRIRGRAVVALLIILAALAGCSALPGADPTPATPGEEAPATDTEEAPATHTEGTPATDTEEAAASPTAAETDASATETRAPPSLAELGVDANATWNRTERVVGLNGTRPPVAVRRGSRPVTPPPFLAAFTGSEPDEPPLVTARYRPRQEDVVLYAHAVENESAETLETLLAHEYAHAIQYQRGWGARNVPRLPTTERTAVATYTEGFGAYVEGRYVERYPSVASARNLTGRYEAAPTHERFVLARYVYGREYYERRVAETENLSAVAADPPASTERVLHDTDEAPRDLRVQTDASHEWTLRERPQGELVTRLVLRDELSADRAVAAAEGWGADRLLRAESVSGDASGYVWVHRWDAVDEADEFEAATAAFLDDRRAESGDYRFELDRLTPETTVVVTGQDGFVDETTVTADSNESVTVTLSE